MKKRIKSPVGELRWMFITGEGRDNSEANDGSEMQKSAAVYFPEDSPEDKQMQAMINEVWESYKQENKNIKPATQPKSLARKIEKDKDTDEPTGMVFYPFKTNSFFPDGKPNNIATHLANGEKFSLGDTRPANGSTGVIHGEAAGYEFTKQFGVTLYLKGVQFKNLKELEADLDVEDIYEEGDYQLAEGEVPEI